MSKAKSTKKPAAPKAAKSAKAPKPAPSENTEPIEKPVVAMTEAPKTEPTPAKKRAAKTADGEAKTKKLSAIDAAAQVLAAASEPMNCKGLIEAMAAQGLWSSPGGKTPAATLYSSILREISTKGAEARFVKTDRGHFKAKG